MKIRDVIKLIEANGWYFVGQKGSHRQYEHSVRPGRVTIAGHTSKELSSENARQCFSAGRLEGETVKYVVVIEKGKSNFSAYVPDLPGCVAAGDSIEEVEELIRGAMEMHIAGLREDGISVPPPSSLAREIDVTI